MPKNINGNIRLKKHASQLTDLHDVVKTIYEHLQQITHTSHPKHTLSPSPIITFVFLVMVAVADYQNPTTKDRVEG
jgi:hypothetical protein